MTTRWLGSFTFTSKLSRVSTPCVTNCFAYACIRYGTGLPDSSLLDASLSMLLNILQIITDFYAIFNKVIASLRDISRSAVIRPFKFDISVVSWLLLDP